MFRLNINKQQLGDIIVLILFDKLFNEDFIKSSALFNDIRDLMNKKGMKGKIFQMYFDIDPSLRSKYKQFSNKINGDQNVSIWIKENEENEEQQNEEKEQLIIETVKRVTGKSNPNEEKLQQLIDELLGDE